MRRVTHGCAMSRSTKARLEAERAALTARITALLESSVADFVVDPTTPARMDGLVPLIEQQVALERRIRDATPTRELRGELARLAGRLAEPDLSARERQTRQLDHDSLRTYLDLRALRRRRGFGARPGWHYLLAGILMLAAIVFVTVILPPLLYGRPG